MELGSLFEYIIREWGLWAGLSMFLIWSTNKRNDERELKYQETIDTCRKLLQESQSIIHNLSSSFEEMKELKNDVKDIKSTLQNYKN